MQDLCIAHYQILLILLKEFKKIKHRYRHSDKDVKLRELNTKIVSISIQSL